MQSICRYFFDLFTKIQQKQLPCYLEMRYNSNDLTSINKKEWHLHANRASKIFL